MTLRLFKVIFVQFLLIVTLSAAGQQGRGRDYRDSDLDGVIDRDDRCPDTPFFALVDARGCTVKRLKVSKEQKRLVSKLLSQNR